MTRTIFAPEMPTEYVTALSALLDHYSWIIPSWCHTLTLAYRVDDDEDGSTRADCLAEPHYRQARIRIYPRWLELDMAERAKTLVHELCHLITAPLSRAVEDIVGASRMSADARTIAEKMQREAEESVVEDLAVALIRISDIYERESMAGVIANEAVLR